jgi:hypothetical protein
VSICVLYTHGLFAQVTFAGLRAADRALEELRAEAAARMDEEEEWEGQLVEMDV